MHNLFLSTKIEKLDLSPFYKEDVILSNYKYQINFLKIEGRDHLKIQLFEKGDLKLNMICYIKDNKISTSMLSGSLASILRKKNLNKNEMINESWDMVRQISLLCDYHSK